MNCSLATRHWRSCCCSGGRIPIAGPLLRELGLGRIAVLTGSPALYGRYNVRVGPFLIFVDAAGLVRASSLANYSWQVAKLRQIAGLPVRVA